ncbi:MAG: NepR family anti-sigma factor, partial [Methyloceanibacter sp.]
MTEDDKDKAPRRMAVDASKRTQRPDDELVEPAAQQDAGMSPALQAHIGRQVRAVFDSVAQEPVPEHLLR